MNIELFYTGWLFFAGGLLTKIIAESKGIKVCSLKFCAIALLVFVTIKLSSLLIVGL